MKIGARTYRIPARAVIAQLKATGYEHLATEKKQASWTTYATQALDPDCIGVSASVRFTSWVAGAVTHPGPATNPPAQQLHCQFPT